MKKNNIIFIVIFVLIIFVFTPVVKADAPIMFYITTDKENYEKNYGAYWTDGITNSNVIKVKRGDIVNVVVAINNWPDEYVPYTLQGGKSTIKWDCDAFELQPVNGKYFDLSISDFNTIQVPLYSNSDPNKYIGGVTYDGTVLNHRYLPYTVSFEANDEVIKQGINKVLQYKFKVKSDVSDGIYSIKAINDDENVVDYDSGYVGLDDDIIYFQIGDNIYNPELNISNVDIPNSTYIIGKYMFTNNVSNAYDGKLTTQHIMSASKSFDSYDLSKMVIYFKNARGNWVNAINNTSINPPETFAISYKDMVEYKSSNSFNGIYKGGFGEIIKMYDLPNNRVQITMIGLGSNSINTGSDIVRNNGTISFEYNSKRYTITKNKNDIEMSTTNTSDFESTDYYRISDYSK